MDRALTALRERPIPPTEKGFAALATRHPISAASLRAERPALHEAGFTFPLMTLREAALRHNIEGMAAYCAAAGVELAPHGKTAMAPQLAAAQLAAGAWGITAATIDQLCAYRAFGVPRVLLANELVDPAGIGWLAGELAADPGFEAYCYVDSIEAVAILDAALTAHGAPRALPVLVEFGHLGGRTGVRTVQGAVDVAAAAAATSTLRVAGVAGYEGGIGHDADARTLAAVAEYCRTVRSLFTVLRDSGLIAGDAILTAGGSSYFDVVTRELAADWKQDARPTVVLRSGAYLSHDHGFYGELSPAERGAAGELSLLPALELWAHVLSRPEPGLALLGAGRRDVAFDQGLPIPLRVRRPDGSSGPVAAAERWEVTALADQHAFLRLPPRAPLSVGDLVCLGISHPCTTFDKWRVIPVVDAEDRVIDAVHTYF
jgi:D-serine deaminase-like pyridoxal phosphate-dependent protein